jgi:hypothetical protein
MLLQRRRETSQQIRGNMKKKIAEHSDDQYWEGRISSPTAAKYRSRDNQNLSRLLQKRGNEPKLVFRYPKPCKDYKKFNDRYKN